jgi:conjugative relaxase-like TrwC/TraI family protein
MIRHHVQKSAADAVRYYQLADYLAEGQVLRPELGGRAAALLGVAGSNDKAHFERLCYNQHPLNGEPLTARTRSDRIVGIDLTFDVPKIWSVLEQLTPNGSGLAEVRRRASLETMREMERAAAVRLRKDGQDANATTGNLVWYRAEHDTDRPVDGLPDMQSHEHYFVLNASFSEEEKQWKAANLYDILRDMPYYQAAFHQRLARGAAELGFDIERKGKHFFDLAGFDPGITTAFSRRTALIEAEAERRGITDPREKAELGAKTREKKAEDFTADQLRRLWANSLTPAQRDSLTEGHLRAAQRQADGVVLDRGDVEAALQHAADHLFERKSSVPARQLLATTLASGVGQFEVSDAWDHLVSKDRFTALVDGRQFVASRAMLSAERELVRLAGEGRATLAPLNPDWQVRDDLLNDEQIAAVRHLLGSKSFVTMVVGAAGVGKTTLVKEARNGAEAAGKQVFAFAPSSDASRVNLAEDFPDAAPVAALLASPTLQQQIRGQVVLVDEAAMLGTKDLLALFRLAKEQDARLWLVGDPKQHRPVAAGEPFDLLTRRAGIAPAIVTRVMRQKDKPYRDLAELARDHPEQAVDRMAEKGWLREVPDAERYQLLAADYLEAVKPRRVKQKGRWKQRAPSAIVVAPTHKEGALVTAAIREGLKARGALGEERAFLQLSSLQLTEAERRDAANYPDAAVIHFTQNAKGYRRGQRLTLSGTDQPEAISKLAAQADRFQVYRAGAVALAVGDRVRITANGKTRDGHRLNNGETLTLAGFSKEGDLIDQRDWVIPKDYGHLRHGYATTSIAAQSRSVEQVLLALGSLSARGHQPRATLRQRDARQAGRPRLHRRHRAAAKKRAEGGRTRLGHRPRRAAPAAAPGGSPRQTDETPGAVATLHFAARPGRAARG